MNIKRTNKGMFCRQGNIGKVMLYAPDAQSAFTMADLFMKAGYTVSIGQMDTHYKGVRIYIWFKMA